MYEERKYRLNKNTDRFEYFTAMYLETDLLIGVNKEGHSGSAVEKTLKPYTVGLIKELRFEMDAFMKEQPDFARSLEPLIYKKTAKETVPEQIDLLLQAGTYARVGPMAGIAGLFSSYVGKALKDKFDLDEIIIENGGDIFAIIKDEIKVKIYAGASVLSEKLALKIKAGEWGICTSSGTVGHSLSFGKADAVVIVSEDPVKADTLATSLANRVRGVSDIQDILSFSEQYEVINTILIICEDQLGVRGRMELGPC